MQPFGLHLLSFYTTRVLYITLKETYISFTAYMFIIQLNTCIIYIYHRHIIYIIYNTYICLIIRFFFIFVALNKKVHKKYRYAYH